MLSLLCSIAILSSSSVIYAAVSQTGKPVTTSLNTQSSAVTSKNKSVTNTKSSSTNTDSLSTSTQHLDGIAAIVNDSVITQSSVEQMLDNIKKNPNKTETAQLDDKDLREEVLNYLISDELMVQEAAKMNIQISDAQLQQAIQQIATNNNTTVSAMLALINKDGVTTKQYEAQIQHQMLIEDVRNTGVSQLITIKPQEVSSLSEQISEHQADNTEFNLSYILIPLPENPTTEQQNTASNMATNIVKAAQKSTLQQVAKSYKNQVKESELGWGNVSDFPSIFSHALQTATKGEVIGPIVSGAGLNIIKVNDVKNASNKKVQVTEYHVRHILLHTSPILSDTQAQQQLSDIAKQIAAKKISFTAAAKEFSQDVMTSDKGGDMGWIHIGIPTTTFAKTLSSLKTNEVSKPIKTEYGWQLLQLLGTRQVDATKETQKEQAYQMLYTQKFNEAFPLWLQQLHNNAYIKIFPSHVDK